MLANVQQKTIKPIITGAIAAGTLIHTDEYGIYARLERWGYDHKTVCHGRGEYARDEDGDGFCEVHVNTIEGFWSLLRSWLRPHRGISQENCRPISASSSSCTTHVAEAEPSSAPSSRGWLNEVLLTTPEPDKSLNQMHPWSGSPLPAAIQTIRWSLPQQVYCCAHGFARTVASRRKTAGLSRLLPDRPQCPPPRPNPP